MARYCSFARNPNPGGRDFVVGDLHGCYDQLDDALNALGFNPATDRLFSVGDLMDRGAFSHRADEFLGQPWFIPARGNHEELFLESVRAGGATTTKYRIENRSRYRMEWIDAARPATLSSIFAKICDLPYAMDVETPWGKAGIIHAEVPNGMAWDGMIRLLEKDNGTAKLWATESRERISAGDRGGVPGIAAVFCGHTKFRNGPRVMGNVHYIDTGAAYDGGALTLVEISAAAPIVHKFPRPVLIMA